MQRRIKGIYFHGSGYAKVSTFMLTFILAALLHESRYPVFFLFMKVHALLFSLHESGYLSAPVRFPGWAGHASRYPYVKGVIGA